MSLSFDASTPGDYLLSVFLHEPNTLLPVPLLAGIPPAGVATFKFASTIVFHRQRGATQSTRRFAIVGAVFSVVQLLSSIITIALYLGSR